MGNCDFYGVVLVLLQLFIIKLHNKPLLLQIFSNPLNKIFDFRQVFSNFFGNFCTSVLQMSLETSLLIW